MTNNPRCNGLILVGTGSMLTLFFAAMIGLLTQVLVEDLSPTGIGPVTAACYYLLGAIWLALSVMFVRSGIWQIKHRRRDFVVAGLVQRLIPWIVGLGIFTPLFGLLFNL